LKDYLIKGYAINEQKLKEQTEQTPKIESINKNKTVPRQINMFAICTSKRCQSTLYNTIRLHTCWACFQQAPIFLILAH